MSKPSLSRTAITVLAGLLLLGAIGGWRVAKHLRSPPRLADAWRASESVVAAGAGLNARQAERFRLLEKAIRDSMTLFMGDQPLAVNRKRVAELAADAPSEEVIDAKLVLGRLLVTQGMTAEALPLYEDSLARAQALHDRARTLEVLKQTAIANLRLGERCNCVSRHNSESCIFPLSPAAVHVDKSGATAAIANLEALLAIAPESYGAIWLLNVAHMQVGTWPDGVAAPFRIPPESFASEHDVGRFHDIAPKLGLNAFNLAGGAIMDDFTNDGNLDLLVSSIDPGTGLKLFRNDGNGKFTDIAHEVGIDGILGGLQIAHADVNNDGRLDILVLRGAWERSNGDMPDSLLVQQADGTFRDVTRESGVEIVAPTQAAAFADIDKDGDLDLYIGCEADAGFEPCRDFPGHLFRNRGDGTFDDVTKSAGVANLRYCKGATFGDYDGDGFPDLYLSNFNDANRLYHNNGDGTFTDVAEQLGVGKPGHGFATWFFDYDNDGWLDLFATYYKATGSNNNEEMGAWYLKGTPGEDTCHLYANDGKGHFTDATVAARMNRVFFPMGASFGDVDNDGFQDLYLATGDPEFNSLWPNVMLRNDGGRRFQDITTSSGTGHLQKGHGVAFGDLDNDGDQDLFEQLGGAFRDDGFWDALFENPGQGNHWLTVRLVGHRSNRFGIGARIKVRIAEHGGARDIYGFVGGEGSFGGNSLQQELGLGAADRIESLEVFWPATGATQRFVDVPLDRFVRVDEERPELELVTQPVIRF